MDLILFIIEAIHISLLIGLLLYTYKHIRKMEDHMDKMDEHIEEIRK